MRIYTKEIKRCEHGCPYFRRATTESTEEYRFKEEIYFCEKSKKMFTETEFWVGKTDWCQLEEKKPEI